MSEEKKRQSAAASANPSTARFHKVAPGREVEVLPSDKFAVYAEALNARVEALDTRARRLGRAFGLPMTPGLDLTAKPTSEKPGELLSAMLALGERVSLDQRDGTWGLYFSRTPALLGPFAHAQGFTVSLKDAPLDAKERFLNRAEEFFALYLEMSKDRYGRMKESLAAGDRALAMLDGLKLI